MKTRDRAHHEPRRDAGPVRDRVGDVAGERGDQEPEGQGAELEQESAEIGSQGAVEQCVLEPDGAEVRQVEDRVLGQDLVRRAGDLVAAEQEPERDEQAASSRERDHVGDARHQDAPDPASPGLTRGRRTATVGGATAVDPGRVRVVGVADRLGDHRVAVVDRPLDPRDDHGLAGEPALVPHTDVGREDHGVGSVDRGLGERLRPGRALGLDRDVDAGAAGGRLERLGGHVGVRDAGRARGDRDQAAPPLGVGRRRRRRRRGPVHPRRLQRRWRPPPPASRPRAVRR